MIKIIAMANFEFLSKIKSEYRILTLAGLISIACGLWENFQQLWLENYGFSPENIANILGISLFAAAVICLVLAWRVKVSRIKTLVAGTLVLQILSLGGLLLFSDMHSMAPVVCFLAITGSLGEKIMILSIWPLMSAYRKDDDTYGTVGLTEYIFRDIGILIGGLFIGRTLGSFVIGYDVFLGLATMFFVCALTSLFWISPVNDRNMDSECLKNVIRQITHDKILSTYFIYYLVCHITFCCAMGLKMLMLTNILGFTPSMAVNYVLILSIIADIIGVICLRWLTPRSDYISMSIKTGGRFLIYLASFLSGNIFVLLAAMTYTLLLSRSFDNRSDGPYINRIQCQGQFSLMATRRSVCMFAESIGMALVGAVWVFGWRYVMGIAALFALIQVLLGYTLIYIREHEIKNNTYDPME